MKRARISICAGWFSALNIGVNRRTLALEQSRSKPNEQVATLIWLVRKYPDTLHRLESLSVPP